ncbi:hypothetical protein RD792_008174 [Penstemon davidsonii]|uniref:F-box domain-containing protein n=1 Tax=Penstemon davidsonii TaxID=160366 RepID=A0ABR0D8G2_9LAMI|nr:hypothetical protein RD792_008174 [Penstemon davidsonii]
MLFFLISCFSFLLISKSFLKPNPNSKFYSKIWAFPCFSWVELQKNFKSLSRKRRIFLNSFQVPILFKNNFFSPNFETVEEKQVTSLLDLPDLPLDCILEKLSPSGLCTIAKVCSSLRDRGRNDHFWEKHMKQKWGGVIGEAAYREWECFIDSKREFLNFRTQRRRFQFFPSFLYLLRNKSEMRVKKCSLTVNSVMSFYVALETGEFWFPAQVFNRENGLVGFTLSCYDAHLSYDSTTDNFIARYPAHGRRIIEADIEWSRIRATTVNTRAQVLHISDCLDELKPNDHIEIQWRRNNEFPYGWWYGVVGHLESCNGNEFNCQCQISDDVMLEFKQHSSGSKWRKTMISKKEHREVGNEADGFYGGIRKLYREEEIAKWKQIWPNCTLE